jgi:hypothetical protein
MSVDERLLGWEPPSPDVDADELLTRVRRTVRRRRQRRFVMESVAVFALFAGALLALVNDDDDTVIDTIGPGLSAPVRYLPENVPDEFVLAWVDDRQDPVAPPAEAEPWEAGVASAYAYGYRSDTVELDVDVFPGYTLDTGDVARSWGADGDTQVMVDEPGRGAVLMESNGLQHAVVEIDGAVLRIVSHGLGDEESTMPFGFLHSFALGFRVVDEQAWQAAIETADVAPPFGVRSAEVLIRGDGWALEGRRTRPPASITQAALALSFNPPSTAQDDMGSLITEWSDLDHNIDPQLTTDDSGRTVAWGVAPPGTASVRLRFAMATVIAPAVPYASATAYAVDVGDQALQLRLVEALDSKGAVLVGMVDATERSCADSGDEHVTVPDLVGMKLWDAVASASRAGLNVVGTGTSAGDPTGDEAMVTAQAPEAGAPVPPGACIGFRTR